MFFRFSERLSVVRTWRARGVKLVRKIVTRQCSCAKSTGRINNIYRTPLVYEHSVHFPPCGYNRNHHRVVVMRDNIT